MKELKEMTRKELAEVIVNDQIKRGVVKPEKKDFQIKARLKGCGYLKAQSWMDLYESALAMI